MIPPNKKTKSSWLLYVLAAVLVGICICAAVIIYLTFLRQPQGSPPDVGTDSDFNANPNISSASLPIFLAPESTLPTTVTTTVSTTTLGIPITTDGISTDSGDSEVIDVSTVSSTSASTSIPTTSTSTEAATMDTEGTTEKAEESTTHVSIPVDVDSILKQRDELNQIVEKCALIQATHTSCRPSSELIVQNSPIDIKPIHYDLNITIRDIRNQVLEGKVTIYAQMLKEHNGVSLHASNLLKLDKDRIRIVNCDSGETICVTRVQSVGTDAVYIETEQRLTADTFIRIETDNFIAADKRAHLYKQITNGKWRVPTMIGTRFEPSNARHLFPSLDSPQHKATVSLCIKHARSFNARSNAELAADRTTEDVSCFERTLPITAQQLAFAAFEETEKLFYNKTSLDGAYLPDVEIISNLHVNFKNQQTDWIYEESSKVMALMSNWTSFSYPLNRLTFVVVPVLDGHSALGLITLPAQAVAHPKHVTTHELLVKEVIGQWMEGIVTTEHTCFEKALVAYLEWKVNEKLQFVKKSRKVEISRIRPRNLNETRSELRMLRSLPKSDGKCAPRFVEVFYTLDETYGQDTVIGMLRVIFGKFAFSTATISDWKAAAEQATGRPEAGNLIGEWFSRENSRPVLLATVRSQQVEFQQLTKEKWTVPLEIASSSGSQLALIQDEKQSIDFVSNDYVVVDPHRKSHAFVVYDADTYLRLIRCFGDSARCPSQEIAGVFADLAAAQLANMLPKPDSADLAKWKSVFKFMAQQNLVEGVAACCVEHAIREMRKCSYWDIQDVCTKIEFNAVLAAAP